MSWRAYPNLRSDERSCSLLGSGLGGHGSAASLILLPRFLQAKTPAKIPAMPMPSRRATLVGTLLAAALVAAVAAVLVPSGIWGRSGLGRLPAGLRPQDLNLVLVTLDTTRADRLGCYGYGDIQT